MGQRVSAGYASSVGEVVAVVVAHLGFYSANAARIVYVVEEANRFGFAYGTLADHGEVGEERFLITRDQETDEVRYELLAYSRPGGIAVKLGYPYSRFLQKSFARDSKLAMLRAASGPSGMLE